MGRGGKIDTIEKREQMLRKQRNLKNKPSKNLFGKMKKHGKDRYLFGYRIQQNGPSMWIMDAMLSAYRPTTIIEMGTGFGMLTTYFSAYAMWSDFAVRIISVDLVLPTRATQISAINNGLTEFYEGNIFADETKEHITKAVNEAERPFVLFDGKDPKSDEVNLYVPDFKAGVPVFSHDANLEGNKHVHWGYKEDKINWNHLERLEPYYSWSKEGDTRMLCMQTK
jgi:cephalosporin hydroxylase